ncbi:MAG: NAD(P)-binding domain-containing protein [Kofleriaceae bacterium]
MTTRGDTLGIVGAGRFGTALALVVARAGRRVVMWSRDRTAVAAIHQSRRSPRLPAAELPDELVATAELGELASAARLVVFAVRSTHMRDQARALGDVIDGSHIVIHAIGALGARAKTPGERRADRVSDVLGELLPTLKLGVLAGPALPEDLIARQFSSMVVASPFDEVVAEGRRLLNAPPVLRVYGSSDFAGVELASALSGAYTVALGLADALGIGPGARAVLVTRVVAEAARFGAAAGAEPRTFAGLAGLGNLLVRGNSERSADYVLGRALARGERPTEATFTEGARAAIAANELAADVGVRVPVLRGIASVLAGTVSAADAARLIGDTVAVEE